MFFFNPHDSLLHLICLDSKVRSCTTRSPAQVWGMDLDGSSGHRKTLGRVLVEDAEGEVNMIHFLTVIWWCFSMGFIFILGKADPIGRAFF